MIRKGVVVFGGATRANDRMHGDWVPGLASVANRPIVHHVLDVLRSLGLHDIVLTGPADVLVDVNACLTPSESACPRLQYAVCEDGSDVIATLKAATPLVGAAPCLVHPGDGLLDEPLAPHVDAFLERSLDLLLLCRPLTAGRHLVNLHDDGALADGHEIPPRCDPAIALFGPGVLKQTCEADSGSSPCRLDTFAQRLCDDGRDVQVRSAEGWRRYTGNPSDLLEVNRVALDLLVPHTCVLADENRIEGRVQIDQTASVTASVIIGPVVVGEGAEVTNSYIGPYTAIGAHAKVEGAEIERSIISPGARVTHVGARLVSSVVGPHAHVFRDFSLPRAMRLRVGEGDEVALC